MSMLNPCHPGEVVFHDCVEALGLSISDAATHLQIDEAVLAAVCACEAPITADLAIRLEHAFGISAKAWLRMQSAYDLSQSRKTACEIKRIERSA